MKVQAWIDALYDLLRPYMNGHVYQNTPTGSEGLAKRAWGDTTYRRLREVKTRYDPPTLLLRAEHCTFASRACGRAVPRLAGAWHSRRGRHCVVHAALPPRLACTWRGRRGSATVHLRGQRRWAATPMLTPSVTCTPSVSGSARACQKSAAGGRGTVEPCGLVCHASGW